MPTAFEITQDTTLESIQKETRGIRAGGGTSIGCGLQLLLDKNIIVNGIVIVSDGGENTSPVFSRIYQEYEKKLGIAPMTYLLHVPGDYDTVSGTMQDFSYEKLEVGNIDYYGLPNLLKMLHTSRYTLYDKIMESKLLTIDEVLKGGKHGN
jgi:hypothetical protein